MAGPPNLGPRTPSVAARLKQGPFNPKAKLDNSMGHVVDMRNRGMDYVHWEDGTVSFIPSPWPGGININGRHPPTGPGGRSK